MLFGTRNIKYCVLDTCTIWERTTGISMVLVMVLSPTPRSLGFKRAQSRSGLCTLGPKVSIISLWVHVAVWFLPGP